MKTLTVFTPTFNRAYCLPRLYESLCSQTSSDFVWLIVDDGSSDDTQTLVESWVKLGIIEIEYVHKKNGGMHTAHNVAYSRIRTPINTCIDSDDWMPVDAVESILAFWGQVADDPDVVGMVGLDVDSFGNLIGSKLPQIERCTFNQLYQTLDVTGDKKLVYRTSALRAMPPYPEFEGEKLVPLSWLYSQFDKGLLFPVNKVWACVDYQAGGSSATVLNQYFASPNGFRELRVVNIRTALTVIFLIKNVIHYGFSSFVIGRPFWLVQSPTPVLSFVFYPASLLLFIYLRFLRSGFLSCKRK